MLAEHLFEAIVSDIISPTGDCVITLPAGDVRGSRNTGNDQVVTGRPNNLLEALNFGERRRLVIICDDRFLQSKIYG